MASFETLLSRCLFIPVFKVLAMELVLMLDLTGFKLGSTDWITFNLFFTYHHSTAVSANLKHFSAL